jgi:hypothetical protein
LLAHGRWFSPASSTTKPGRHDIAEILLKVALKTQKIDQSDILLIEFEDDITIKIYEKRDFSYIVATSFSDGGSWSTRREPPTMGKQLVNFITCGCESSAPCSSNPYP